MTTNIHRGPLTTQLIGALVQGLAGVMDGGIPVGDGVVPPGAGWSGEPNAPGAKFNPYVVLIAGTANSSQGPLGDSQSDWRFPYMLGSYAASRAGVDIMSDNARDVLGGLRGQVYSLGEDNYSVQYVRVESIGGTNRVDQTDPPYWGQTDSLTVWMTKEF